MNEILEILVNFKAEKSEKVAKTPKQLAKQIMRMEEGQSKKAKFKKSEIAEKEAYIAYYCLHASRLFI